MISMTRNRKVFYSADLDTVTMAQDSDGNYVEESYTYTDPVKRVGVISAANGEAQAQLFGANEIYDKVITLNLGENYLDIGSILWVDTEISLDADGKLTKTDGQTDTPHDYIVVKVAKSLNFVNVAIRKVDVS